MRALCRTPNSYSSNLGHHMLYTELGVLWISSGNVSSFFVDSSPHCRNLNSDNSMLLPRYQPACPGTVTLTSLSDFETLASCTVKHLGCNARVSASLEVSHQHLVITEKRKWTRNVKDVWRPERSEDFVKKISEAAESTSFESNGALLHTSSLSTLNTCNGSHLGHVGQLLEIVCNPLEGKKPTQSGKDVWRPERTNGCDGMGGRTSEGKSYTHSFKQQVESADHVSIPVLALQNENFYVKPLGITNQMLKVADDGEDTKASRKKTLSGKDMRGLRGSRDPSLEAMDPADSRGSRRVPRRRLYLVDMHPLCYESNKVQPRKVIEWMELLFTQVTADSPIIAVMDGERGNEYRRALMPAYKAKRNKYRPLAMRSWRSSPACDLREALPIIQGFLSLCHIPVVKLEMVEADDVVATLTRQARDQGLEVVVASPDMDFRQLLAPEVQLLIPVPEFGRWSFYTLQHYVTQHQISPDLDLGMRCLLGDATDNVPGLSELAPGFGKKTALKLMQKHGSLEGLIKAAATRTVGKDYVQDALTKHADLLRRNLQVLSLRTDVNIDLKEQWCRPRSNANDVLAFELLKERLQSKSLSSYR